MIGDPFYRDNERQQQWIGKTDWEYQTTLRITQQLLAHEQVELVFEGLDTYAEVYLNDNLVLRAITCFVPGE
jgi:beta-mannosidase